MGQNSLSPELRQQVLQMAQMRAQLEMQARVEGVQKAIESFNRLAKMEPTVDVAKRYVEPLAKYYTDLLLGAMFPKQEDANKQEEVKEPELSIK